MSLRENIGYNKADSLKFKLDKGEVFRIWKTSFKLQAVYRHIWIKREV